MRQIGTLATLFAIATLSMGGCAWLTRGPISKPVFELQRPAVQAATESAESASGNWGAYNAEQQGKFLKANAKAWSNFNRVYNPPEESD